MHGAWDSFSLINHAVHECGRWEWWEYRAALCVTCNLDPSSLSSPQSISVIPHLLLLCPLFTLHLVTCVVILSSRCGYILRHGKCKTELPPGIIKAQGSNHESQLPFYYTGFLGVSSLNAKQSQKVWTGFFCCSLFCPVEIRPQSCLNATLKSEHLPESIPALCRTDVVAWTEGPADSKVDRSHSHWSSCAAQCGDDAWVLSAQFQKTRTDYKRGKYLILLSLLTHGVPPSETVPPSCRCKIFVACCAIYWLKV